MVWGFRNGFGLERCMVLKFKGSRGFGIQGCRHLGLPGLGCRGFSRVFGPFVGFSDSGSRKQIGVLASSGLGFRFCILGL